MCIVDKQAIIHQKKREVDDFAPKKEAGGRPLLREGLSAVTNRYSVPTDRL